MKQRHPVVDRNGEPLTVGGRVMLDGALTADVVAVDETTGIVRVKVDGDEEAPAVLDLHSEPVGWTAADIESLGDEINLAMRAAKGQPS